MPRYIDADEITNWLAKYNKMDEFFVGYLETLVETIPTADVVQVVRCGECKYWGESLTEKERNECDVYADLVCSYWMSDGLTRDDFCSQGERRE